MFVVTDVRVRIRPYRLQDRQEVMSLAGRLEIGVAPWRDPDAVRAAVAGWVRGSLDGCAAEDREVFVAVDGARLVGFVTVGQRQHFTGETDAYVGELVVAEAAERRGVGTLLMQAAEQWGRGRGLKCLTLETGAANSTARAFYASLGYQEEDVRLTKELDHRTDSKDPSATGLCVAINDTRQIRARSEPFVASDQPVRRGFRCDTRLGLSDERLPNETVGIYMAGFA